MYSFQKHPHIPGTNQEQEGEKFKSSARFIRITQDIVKTENHVLFAYIILYHSNLDDFYIIEYKYWWGLSVFFALQCQQQDKIMSS